MRGQRRHLELGAKARGHCHLGERHEQAAVGDIVDRRRHALCDQRAHEVAVLALGGEIDGGRRAFLATANIAQIE